MRLCSRRWAYRVFGRSNEGTCFTNVNVVDRKPPTTNLHLCFHARSRDQVDAFHAAGLAAGFRSNGAPAYRDYQPGYYAAYLLDPDDNNVEALYGTSAASVTASATGYLDAVGKERV